MEENIFIYIYIRETKATLITKNKVPQTNTFLIYKVKSLWILRACLIGGMRTGNMTFSHTEMSLGWKFSVYGLCYASLGQ